MDPLKQRWTQVCVEGYNKIILVNCNLWYCNTCWSAQIFIVKMFLNYFIDDSAKDNFEEACDEIISSMSERYSRIYQHPTWMMTDELIAEGIYN